MGLTTWRNAPAGKILKYDVSVAKNYLIEEEIKELPRIVSMYLDYAENQAARQTPMKMTDWVTKLDAFLQFNEYEVLTNAVSVSAEVAKRLAEEQYSTFRVQQDRNFESDFEREMKRISKKKGQRPEGGHEALIQEAGLPSRISRSGGGRFCWPSKVDRHSALNRSRKNTLVELIRLRAVQ